MKNALTAVLLLLVVVIGYYAATTLRMPQESAEGRLEIIRRGNLTLPINATGEVRTALRVEIKSEASGEVIEIAKRGGERVKAGDLLIRLQKDDEQRSVHRAKQDLQIALARLETAKITLDQAKGPDLSYAQSQVDQMIPMVEYAKYRLDRIETFSDDVKSEEEVVQRRTEHLRQVAQLESARANLEKAKLVVPRAEFEVKQAEATYEAAQSTLADAEKRLAKTDIVSPINGVVGDIKTQIGEVIQGGKSALSIGTVLAVVLDVDKIIVRAEVDESDIGRVLAIAPPWAQPKHDSTVLMPPITQALDLAGAHAPRIGVESFRDEDFTGVIERIYPEPRTLQNVVTYLVDVLVTGDNRDLLLPGMRADVRFTSEHVENALLCPNEAIRKDSRGRWGVYVPKPDSSPADRETEFVECRFGLDNGNYSEIHEGLAEGSKVYTKLPVRTDKGKDK